MLNRFLFLIISILVLNTQCSFASLQQSEEEDTSGPYKKMLTTQLKRVKGVTAEQAQLLAKANLIIKGYKEVYEEIDDETSYVSLVSSRVASLKDFLDDFVTSKKMLVAAPVLLVAVASGAYFLMFTSESGEVLEILNAMLNAAANVTLKATH